VQSHSFERDVIRQSLAGSASVLRLISASHVLSFSQKELDESFIR
jgi:hypothetical protein